MSTSTGYGTGSLHAQLLDGLKDFLNITGTSSDAELAVFLEAAQGVVEDRLPAPLEPASTIETFPVGQRLLVLSKAPILSIDVVRAPGRLLPLTVDQDVVVELDHGLVHVMPSAWGLGSSTLTVAYTYGWGRLPAALRLALFVVAGHLWETQRGTDALPSPGVDQPPAMAPAAGYAMPNRALELLAPYARGPRV